MNTLRILGAILALALSAPGWGLGRMADISVQDRASGKTLPVHWHHGQAWVVGRPGNEYRIRLRNRTGADVLAVVSVDGVNVITGQDATPAQSGYVLAPRRSLDILGWRKSLAQTAAFYFTPLPDSYAARTGRPDNVGVIGIALFAKKRAVPPAPIAKPGRESQSRARPSARESGTGSASNSAGSSGRPGAAADAEVLGGLEERIGTGHGRREVSRARHVRFERAGSRPSEVIRLYYDSRENLIARGIIRERVRVAPCRSRCAPCGVPCPPVPFPGFAPDPWSAYPAEEDYSA